MARVDHRDVALDGNGYRAPDGAVQGDLDDGQSPREDFWVDPGLEKGKNNRCVMGT